MASHRTITKTPGILVRPREPTPRESLRLSVLDRLPGMRLSVDVAFVYGHGGGEEPAKAIREGLSRALVHYYPVAGRIAEAAGGDLKIDCTSDCGGGGGDGDGVWFVEASADGRLDGLTDPDSNLRATLAAELMARPPPEVNLENVVFMMQVTEFKCGSFTVGITYNHTVFDGVGSAQFVNAVAELTRGLAEPTVSPTWRRELIPSPPPRPTSTSSQGPTGPEIQFTSYKFKSAEFDVSLHSINQIKDRVAAETGQSCSTFDAVAAVLWRSRTRAINLEPDADVSLSFMANARRVLHELLSIEGGGYYGNCVYPAGITLPSRQVANASLVALVGAIREAKQTVSDGFSRWIKRGEATNLSAPPNYGMLIVSDWNRLGYSEIDYRWGEPSYVFPCGCSSEFNVLGVCNFIRLPVPKQGVRLVMYCVEEQHSAALHDELLKFA